MSNKHKQLHLYSNWGNTHSNHSEVPLRPHQIGKTFKMCTAVVHAVWDSTEEGKWHNHLEEQYVPSEES